MSTNLTLTARELELLKEVGKSLQTASVDWASVAKNINFKTPKAARDKWYPLRDKLFGAGGAEGAPASASKKAATPRKRKTPSDQDDDEATPSKSAKKSKGKKANTPVADEDDEETSQPGPVKKEVNGDDDDADDYL